MTFSAILFQWFWAVYLTLLSGTGLVPLAGLVPFMALSKAKGFSSLANLYCYEQYQIRLDSTATFLRVGIQYCFDLLDAHILSLEQMARAVSITFIWKL